MNTDKETQELYRVFVDKDDDVFILDDTGDIVLEVRDRSYDGIKMATLIKDFLTVHASTGKTPNELVDKLAANTEEANTRLFQAAEREKQLSERAKELQLKLSQCVEMLEVIGKEDEKYYAPMLIADSKKALNKQQ